jgi:hypothetical protein
MWTLAIPIVIVILFMVYNYVILPRMKKNYENKAQELTVRFSDNIRGKEEQTRKDYVRNNPYIKSIAQQVQHEDIEGIISCMEKRELKDFLRQQAINMAGSAVGRVAGIGFKETDNTEYYYLVLTKPFLHYLRFSENGECKEHLKFDRSWIQQLESGTVTSGDMLKNNAAAGESKRLSFVSNDTLYKFFFYNHFWGQPSVKSSRNKEEEFAELNYLFATPFKTYASTLAGAVRV